MNRDFRSLRDKLQAIVLVATLVALAGALAANMAGNLWSFHRRQVAEMGTQAELLGRMTAPALVFDDARLAQENLALFEARPDVESAAIYGPDGRLFASYARAGRATGFPSSPGSDGVRVEGADLVVWRPIVNDDTIVGRVYLRVRYDLFGLFLGDFAVAAAGGLFAMLLAYLMIRRLGRRIVGPISEVATAAREVVEQRDYSRRVRASGNDEVGELVAAFNGMLHEVERGTAEILSLNASLEQRVQERTAELESSNRELSMAKSAADDASRAKSDFLATMSHEIRTPMNGVIGMVDVLHQTSLNGHQVEMVDLVRESALALLTVIDDILDFSKIEAGRLELESMPLSLLDTTESACGMFDHLALRKDVEFMSFVDPALPARMVGDPLRLRQVLVNLVNNAIKFSGGRPKAGKVAVRVRPVARDATSATVEIEVSDNGIGIDAGKEEHLFTPFTQADLSTTRRFGGTGLGLAICRHLVHLMGGELLLRSTLGLGSTFTVRLPLQLAPDVPGNGVPAALAGLTCFVVGDARAFAGDIAAYLRDDGASVEVFPALAGARARGMAQPGGNAIWVLDLAGAAGGEDDLAAFAGTGADRRARAVAIGRGPCRIPHWTPAGVVAVDGNAMTRRRLRSAVELAAGLVAEATVDATPGRHRLAFEAPTRAQALRDGHLVLVAEDNETNQKVIAQQLALLGFAADIAPNGRLALDRWQSGGHVLLLTDLHMPLMDGYELTAAIRNREQGVRRIPIVALTANALKGEADRCRVAGMDGYLTKPLQLADLKALLERCVPGAVAAVETPSGGGAGAASRALDVRVLERLVGGDPAVVAELLMDFRASCRTIAKALGEASDRRDFAEATALAHKLKSSARTVGAIGLGEACGRIEDACKTGDGDQLAALKLGFQRQAAEVDACLDEIGIMPPGAGRAR
jgi:signal transduction histidine kinase/HPt (histidine-containing phosphotransfer) domain-containing protein/ActR/RegA family two-component response regulator